MLLEKPKLLPLSWILCWWTSRVRGETSRHDQPRPAQPRAACIWPQWPPHLDWHNFGGENRI